MNRGESSGSQGGQEAEPVARVLGPSLGGRGSQVRFTFRSSTRTGRGRGASQEESREGPSCVH